MELRLSSLFFPLFASILQSRTKLGGRKGQTAERVMFLTKLCSLRPSLLFDAYNPSELFFDVQYGARSNNCTNVKCL